MNNKPKDKNWLIHHLELLYSDVGNDWIKKNSLLLNYARGSRLALGGSIAMAITRKRAIKVPGDIDLFTNSVEDAEKFITKIRKYLDNRTNTYYSIQINNETPHCLEGVKRHYRISIPFWKKVCVMVLKEPIRTFIWNGTKIQYFDDVVKAAKQATTIDGKERVNITKTHDFYLDDEILNTKPKTKSMVEKFMDDVNSNGRKSDFIQDLVEWDIEFSGKCIT